MENYDLIIKNGRIMDPASNFEGNYNIGVKKGKIHTLTLNDINGKLEINASGLIVSPGFIDTHAEVDGVIIAAEGLARLGVTSAISGNCGTFFADSNKEEVKEALQKLGFKSESKEELLNNQEELMKLMTMDIDVLALRQSKEEIGAFLDRIDKNGYPINIGKLVGAQAIRQKAGAMDKHVPATIEQLERMKKLLDEGMKQGAFGVSFGLAYVPGTSKKEIIELFKISASHNGIGAAHPRFGDIGFPGIEGDALDGERELIDAARISNIKLHISHIEHQISCKAKAGEPYDALFTRSLGLIEDAIKEGISITADSVFCNYGSTSVSQPFLDFLLKPGVTKYYGTTMEKSVVVRSGPYKGKPLTLELFKKLRKIAPNTEIVSYNPMDLVIRAILPSYVMFGTDASTEFGVEFGVPVYPYILGEIVREREILSLMEALYKMTILPASRFNLKNKGRIAVGVDADFAIFDPKTIHASFSAIEPGFDVKGMEWVIVNGVPVIRHDKILGATPGKALRHEGWN